MNQFKNKPTKGTCLINTLLDGLTPQFIHHSGSTHHQLGHHCFFPQLLALLTLPEFHFHRLDELAHQRQQACA